MRDPKNAAFELQVRWAGGDFATAMSLASGAAAEQLAGEAARCDNACVALRAARRTTLLSRATVVDQSAGKALVIVETDGLTDLPGRWVLEMTQVDGTWKAATRRPAAPDEVFKRSSDPTPAELISVGPSAGTASPHGASAPAGGTGTATATTPAVAASAPEDVSRSPSVPTTAASAGTAPRP